MTRDPRFDDLSGKLNHELFKKSYAFLDEIRDKERKVCNCYMLDWLNDSRPSSPLPSAHHSLEVLLLNQMSWENF